METTIYQVVDEVGRQIPTVTIVGDEAPENVAHKYLKVIEILEADAKKKEENSGKTEGD